MKINQLIATLRGVKTIQIKTLGKRSCFSVHIKRDTIVIINSKNNCYNLVQSDLDRVNKRLESLDKTRQRMSSEYVDPKWPERPNRIFSPYIAALLLHLKQKTNSASIKKINKST